MGQLAYRIDLTKIDGDGEFPCPRCGVNIRPEDITNDKYDILRINSENGFLEEVVIACKKCESTIYLVGFSLGIYLIGI